jgi:hypothetical protein
MATTAADQINGALRLIGMLAEGEVPSAATSQDALTALNQMRDSLANARCSSTTPPISAMPRPTCRMASR